MSTVLETENIAKSFGAVRALNGVHLRLEEGEVQALLGQNGAGKSTLVRILNGVHPARTYTGRIWLRGVETTFSSPADARRQGIGYVPQELLVLEQLSVAENILVGQMGIMRRARVEVARVRSRAEELIGRLGLKMDPTAPMSSLSAAQRQMVMVARALAANPSVLMLDEPTASLSLFETNAVFSVLRRLREQGVTMVFITHRIPEAVALADSITVLRDGQVVTHLKRADFDQHEIVRAMVGRRLSGLYPQRTSAPDGDDVLQVDNLTVPHPKGLADLVHDVSFTLRRGEVLGLAGLVGSGRTEILSAIYGAIHRSGRVLVDGREIPAGSPIAARRAGLAMLSEDRKSSGLLFNFTVSRNITVGNLEPVSHRGIIDFGEERRQATAFMNALAVKSESGSAAVDHLSGGNQQKVLLARVLMNRPRVLLLDEPTKGVDVGTKQEIYRLILKLADEGVGLIVVSSELDELLGICDRCLVVAGGAIVDEFGRGEGSEHRVLQESTRGHSG